MARHTLSSSLAHGFVVTFAGARDGYQVPLALAERNQLARLVTDVYLPGLRTPFGKALPKLTARHVHGVSIFRAWSSPEAIWHTHAAWRLGATSGRSDRYRVALKRAQDALSKDALRLALLHRAHLFCYGGYARHAFADPRMAGRRRVLFMYHPHVALSADILRNDLSARAEADASLDELRLDEVDRDIDLELQNATDIVCASTFTARTVEAIGIPRSRLRIIPYGIDLPTPKPETMRGTACRFLFVGTGTHRKGLHILFDAWQRANLQHAELIVVCRSLVPWIAARKPADVEVKPGVTPTELDRLYATSDVFVMPSLIEGFGYVYLEALARGCFTIGTENTGLPDLHPPPEAAALARAGDVDSLVQCLREGHQRWSAKGLERERIREFAGTWGWRRFRSSIGALCAERNDAGHVRH